MAWRLRAGVSLHPMPFGGAFVLDDARLAARQISCELTRVLAGAGSAAADPPPPVLAAELRLGVDDGWLIHQEERHEEPADLHDSHDLNEPHEKPQGEQSGDEQEEKHT